MRRPIRPVVYLIFLSTYLLSGCATTPSRAYGTLGKSAYRNVVILGENLTQETATQYANKYNARVLYKKSRGFLTDAVNNSMRALGPSRAMRDLIKELESLSNTQGAWMLFIPASAKRYFLLTLRNMDDSAVTNAHGQIILVGSSANEEISREVDRIFGKSFVVIQRREQSETVK